MRKYDVTRRVAVAYGDFVVVVFISVGRSSTLKANFVTCFDANNSIGKIRQSPIWNIADFTSIYGGGGGGR